MHFGLQNVGRQMCPMLYYLLSPHLTGPRSGSGMAVFQPCFPHWFSMKVSNQRRHPGTGAISSSVPA